MADRRQPMIARALAWLTGLLVVVDDAEDVWEDDDE